MWYNIIMTRKDFQFEREEIMGSFYDWSHERDMMLNIQQCQRNWDYDKWDVAMDTDGIYVKERINELLWVAQNSPSKQHEGYYDLYYTADRDVIQEISRYTWGNTYAKRPPSTWRNSQANASLYILWVAKKPDTELNCNADGTTKSNSHHERWFNAYCSIGISMGLTMRAASKMGYATGCNKSHNDLNGDDYWENKLGILDDVKSGDKRIAYGLGIGYPQEGRNRWEMDETELLIGAGNGSKITTTGMETHPRTGKAMRKATIVDIRATDMAIDPYGVEHSIPDEANSWINTVRPRNIYIKEIK